MSVDVVIGVRERLLGHFTWLVGAGDVEADEVWFAQVPMVFRSWFGPKENVFGFWDR